MKKKWKVQFRETCLVCGEPLPKRFRIFCGKKCRMIELNKRRRNDEKHKEKMLEWNRKKRDQIASIPSKNKCQCLLCGKWYVQVGSHITQMHGMTAREYRERMDLEVKRGIVPEWYRKLKGEKAIENDTFKNLKAGKKFRFKKGQNGLGRYHRSPVTIERLKKLHKLTQKNVIQSAKTSGANRQTPKTCHTTRKEKRA